jgi:hypothetical protein
MTEQNSRNRKFAAVCVLTLVVLLLCGSGEGQNGFPFGSMDSSIVSSATAVSFPRSNHVFVVMLENQDFSQVFPSGRATNCSFSGMPYLCSLAARYGNALNFYANVHGSLLDYLYNTSGATWTGAPYDCTGTACAYPGVVTGNNIIRALTNYGKTWRAYFEGMPSRG